MNTLTDSRAIQSPVLEHASPFVAASEIRKSFGDKEVLSRIDFAMASGEIVAIIGRSGCGKSTLLRLIAGLDKPSVGQITINGKLLTGINSAARLMFQDASLLPWRTVLQNVTLASPQHDIGIANRALAAVGLDDRGEDWPTVLSGGQRQRVALARALASGVPFLLLDEPLGALDALTKLEMQALIERVWQEKQISILLITHDVEEAIALADRVMVMKHGRFTLETSVPLSRPRNRSSIEFVQLRDKVLHCVLNGTKENIAGPLISNDRSWE